MNIRSKIDNKNANPKITEKAPKTVEKNLFLISNFISK